jgi:hypothetical protein
MKQLQWYMLLMAMLIHRASFGMLALPNHMQDLLVKNYLNATSVCAISSLNNDFHSRFFSWSKTKHAIEFVENGTEKLFTIPINESNFPLLKLSKKDLLKTASLSLIPESIIVSENPSRFLSLAKINWINNEARYRGDLGLKALVECTYPTKNSLVTFKRKSETHFSDTIIRKVKLSNQCCTDDEKRMLLISQWDFDFELGFNGMILYLVTSSWTKKVMNMKYCFTADPIHYDPVRKSFIVPSSKYEECSVSYDHLRDLIKIIVKKKEKKEKQKSTKSSIGRTIAHKKSQLLQNFHRF